MLTRETRSLIPDYVEELKPYVPGKTIEEIKEHYNPERVSKLASNENRWGTSPKVEEAVRKGLETMHNYPDPSSSRLKHLLAEKYELQPKNIVLGNGSESLLSTIAKTFFGSADEAVTADGTFVGFFIQARIRGIDVHRVPLRKDYSYDLEGILKAINNQTKLIYIANPNNPTGTYITRSEFESFIERVPEDILVIMDEAYFEFARDLEDYPDSMDYRFDNVLTLRTFSKAYGLAGFRIGYLMGHPDLVRYINKTKLVFEPSTPAQLAAEAALKDGEFLEFTIRQVKQARKYLYKLLDEYGIDYSKSAANSVMTVFSTEREAAWFTEEMMKQGVILRKLDGFGMPNAVRITVGRSSEMRHFEEVLRDLYG